MERDVNGVIALRATRKTQIGGYTPSRDVTNHDRRHNGDRNNPDMLVVSLDQRRHGQPQLSPRRLLMDAPTKGNTVGEEKGRPKNLYDGNAIRPESGSRPTTDSPGTTLTASIETIDNDRAANLRGVGTF